MGTPANYMRLSPAKIRVRMSSLGSNAVNMDEVGNSGSNVARLTAIVSRTFTLQRDPRRFGDERTHEHGLAEFGIMFDHGVGFLRYGGMADHQGGEVRLEAPALYFVPAGIPHSTRWEKRAEVFCAHLKLAFWRRRMFGGRQPTLGPGVVPGGAHDMVFWESASSLRHLWDERRSAEDETAPLLAESLLLRAATILLGDLPSAASDGPNGSGLSGARKAIVDQFIDRQMAHRLHATDIARAVGLSASHFTALLKNSTDKTVHQYVTEQRLRRAHQYLASGNYTLSEVAHAVGYQDVEYFSAKFTAYFNYTAKSLMKRGRILAPKTPEKS